MSVACSVRANPDWSPNWCVWNWDDWWAVRGWCAGEPLAESLRHLPIDEVKLDRSFTASITEDPRVAAIVRSVIDLSHTLGLTTVVEGVENSATAAVLTGYGCDIAQGHHYSQPLTAP